MPTVISTGVNNAKSAGETSSDRGGRFPIVSVFGRNATRPWPWRHKSWGKHEEMYHDCVGPSAVRMR